MINFSPSPTLLEFGFVKIHWYGLIFVIAVLSAMFLINKLAKKYNYDRAKIEDLYFYLLIFGIIGARIYSVLFFDFDYYKNNLIDIFKIWQGGIAIQGAIISGIITLFVYCKKNKLNFAKYLDIFAVAIPLAQAIGRWGNFFNGELYGKISNLPWAIYIKETGFYHHPLFLYESILDLILFFILRKLFKNKKFDGQIILFYLLGYGIIRFFMEFLRVDETVLIFGIRFPQVVSLLLIVFSTFEVANLRGCQPSR